MEKLKLKYKLFPTGSSCITLNRGLETEEDTKLYQELLEKVNRKYENKKIPPCKEDLR